MLAVFFPSQAIAPGSLADELYYGSDTDAYWGRVAESPAQYRPRHPERSAFYRLFDNHFDRYGQRSCALSRSSFPAGGSREDSRAFAASNAARSIFWRSLAGQGISVRAVRPNAPSCSLKNSAPKFLPLFHTVAEPFHPAGSARPVRARARTAESDVPMEWLSLL